MARWLIWTRRLAPGSTRDRVFDPVAADLAADRAERLARSASVAGRAWAHARYAAGALAAALGCWRISWRESAGLGGLMRQMAFDARHTIRLLWRRPGFTVAAVLTLALGIGPNTAIFSYVNHLLLAGAPVPEPEGLVRVAGRTSERDYDTISFPNYRDLRDSGALDLAAHVTTSTRVGDATSREARLVELVTGNYFRVMKVPAARGRVLDDTDAAVEGARPVVVVSDAYWRTEMHADPGVIGSTVRLGGVPFEVVGVAGGGFRGAFGGELVDFWAPLSMHGTIRPRNRSYEVRGWGWLWMVGRLPPETAVASAQARLDRVAEGLHQQYEPKEPRRTDYLIFPARLLPETSRRSLMPILGGTFAFTLLLFLVTCANLAGLMQTRLAARSREVAIRYSLGSSRGQMVRLWLIESVALALLGGVAGLALGRWTTMLLAGVRPPAQFTENLPTTSPFDWTVILFAGGLSLLAAGLFGWAPALGAGRSRPLDMLRDAGVTSTGGRRQARLRRLVVAAQVTMSVVLLVASALLVRSLRNQQLFDPGFPTDRLGVVSIDLVNQRIPAAEGRAMLADALARIRQIPGVTNASAGLMVPLGFGSERRGLRIPGYQAPGSPPNAPVSVDYSIVDARYFVTLGIPILKGRVWDESAAAAGAREVVISEAMAQRYFADRDPIGQPVELMGDGMFTVSGVAKTIAHYAIGEAPRPYIYFSDHSMANFQPTFFVRTAGAPGEPLTAVTRLLKTLDARIAPARAITFEDLRRIPLFPGRALACAAAAFGVLALLLTAVGLYGVIAASVGQRTREIGVRVALGADAHRVVRGILMESLALAGAGAAFGFAGAYLTARGLEAFLFQIGPFDAVAYGVVAALVAGVAVAAAWLPARRAARIDPVAALR